MKYLNLLNTESDQSQYVANITNGMKIGANAKIALEQLNLTFAGEEITIDSTNDSFQFNPYERPPGTDINVIGPEAIRAVLPHTTHRSRTTLIQDIENAINSAVRWWAANMAGSPLTQYANYQGLQFRVFVDNNNKLNIAYANTDLTTNNDLVLKNVVDNANPGGGVDPNTTFYLKNAGDAAQFDGVMQSRFALSKSNCKISATFKTTIANGASDWIIGVSKIQYTDGAVFDLDKYYIALYSTSTVGETRYWVKIGSNAPVQFTPAVGAGSTKTTNITTFALSWGVLTDTVSGSVSPKLVVSVKDGNRNALYNATRTNIYDFNFLEYVSSPNYFTCSAKQLNNLYILHDLPANDNQALAMVLSAFETKLSGTNTVVETIPNSIRKDHITVDYSDYENVENLQIDTNYRTFIFDSLLNEVLGFNMSGIVYPSKAGNSALISENNIPDFITMTGFSPKNLIVQLPMLDIESYSNTGRHNVLAVVPNSDRNNYDLSYKVNEKLFIALKNKKPDTINSMRIVITNDDGEIFPVSRNTLNVALVITDDDDKK